MKVAKHQFLSAAEYYQKKGEAALARVKSLPIGQATPERLANEAVRTESQMAFIAETACRKCAEFLP